MHKVYLPKLGIHRDQAVALFTEYDIPERLDGLCFVVIFHQSRAVSDTFVDALVEEALRRGVAEIALVGWDQYAIPYAEDAAWRRGQADVVAVRSAVDVGV